MALEIENLVSGAKGPKDQVEPPRPKPPGPPPPRFWTKQAAPILAVTVAAAAFVLQDAVRRTLSEIWIGTGAEASLERATALDSSNAAGWYRLGLRRSLAGETDSAIEDFERAIDDGAAGSAPLVALASELETAGRLSEAEARLLEAAQRDAGFRPRWSLANYYLRHGNEEETWRWTRDAIRVDPSRLATAASFGWRAEAEPATILARAIPDTPEANYGYFSYLYDVGELEAMKGAWSRFSASLSPDNTQLATQYVDRLIQAGAIKDAVAAWNLLCDRLLLPHIPLGTGEQPQFLTNPHFTTDPSGVGFDWTIYDYRGTNWARPRGGSANSSAVEFRLTGAQQNRITLLSQIMPAEPGEYLFEFDFATQGMPIRTGVGWIVRDAITKQALRNFESLNNAEGFWDSVRFTYSVPEGVEAVSLELFYQDVEGGERRRGAALVRNLTLTQSTRLGARAE